MGWCSRIWVVISFTTGRSSTLVKCFCSQMGPSAPVVLAYKYTQTLSTRSDGMVFAKQPGLHPNTCMHRHATQHMCTQSTGLQTDFEAAGHHAGGDVQGGCAAHLAHAALGTNQLVLRRSCGGATCAGGAVVGAGIASR